MSSKIKAAQHSEHEPAIVEHSLVGQTIGSYQVRELLGAGGMGSVYLAAHSRLARLVAIKTLSTQDGIGGNAEARARFFREAQALTMLKHPCLVEIFDCGELSDGRPYIVMEYLRGVTLRTRMVRDQSNGVPAGESVSVGRQIAEAMTHAHSHGIVHRDLKPENIMLVEEDGKAGERAKVLDFGIARFLRSIEHPTLATQGILGTPSYMSPEQCRGDKNLDGQSDVYALGCILFEMLAGRAPFEGTTTINILTQQLGQTAPRLRKLRPQVPAALADLVAEMLDKRPRRRPTMADVAAELTRISTGRGLSLSRRTRHGGTRIAYFFCMALFFIGLMLAGIEWYFHWVHHRHFLRSSLPVEVALPGGGFLRGSTSQEISTSYIWAARSGCEDCERNRLYEREQPLQKVELSPFYLDATETTVHAFVDWLNELSEQQGRGDHERLSVDSFNREVRLSGILLVDLFDDPGYSGIRYHSGKFQARREMENLPIVNVTWDGARLYCEHYGKRLPTEAEWEFAARGHDKRYRFPWGDREPSCEGTIFGRGTRGRQCPASGAGVAPVGQASQDRTEDGILDLGGNVSEWVQDYFRLRYPECLREPCRNPVVALDSEDPAEQHNRVVRGGAWSMEMESVRAATRSRQHQSAAFGNLGFRCARSKMSFRQRF